MVNLLSKIFINKKDKFPIVNEFSTEEIKPILETLGIDLDKIGFPHIQYRNSNFPSLSYQVSFNNIKITPVKINNEVSTIITGIYKIQDKTAYASPTIQEEYFLNPVLYSFVIKNKELNIHKK